MGVHLKLVLPQGQMVLKFIPSLILKLPSWPLSPQLFAAGRTGVIFPYVPIASILLT